MKAPHFPAWAARDLARAYVLLANYAYDLGREELAWTAYQQSSQIDPSTAAFNRLAFLAFRRSDHPLAVTRLKTAGPTSTPELVSNRYSVSDPPPEMASTEMTPSNPRRALTTSSPGPWTLALKPA